MTCMRSGQRSLIMKSFNVLGCTWVGLYLKISFHMMKWDGINTRQVANRLSKNRKDTPAKDDIS